MFFDTKVTFCWETGDEGGTQEGEESHIFIPQDVLAGF